MNKKTVILTIVGSLLTAFAAFAAEWSVDASHSEVGFTVKHMVISKVNGKFTDYAGEIALDPENVEAAVIKGAVQVNSIDTGNQNRDNHLRGSDFFDAENYPQILFESTKIRKMENGFVAVGKLTMRGVTKEIEIPFTLVGPINDPWGGTRIALEGSTTINRLDWGLAWDKVMENGGLVVSHDVVIRLSAELIKK